VSAVPESPLMSDRGKNVYGLDGETVIVTGSGRGIGAGIAELLCRAGANVVVADIDGDTAQIQAAALNDAGYHASYMQIDVSDEAAVIQAFARVGERQGALWGLVNNAAILDRQLLLETTVDEWERIMAVNARGAFLATREAAKAMIAAGRGGRIVNVASAALIGAITQGHAAYAASKSALAGLTRASAMELVEHAITVNMILPGAVATPGAIQSRGPAPEGPGRRASPLGMCEPEDIGAAAVFFLSPAAGAITNQSLAVDGGWSVT